jgi:AcrR family transcriptional regulator
MSVQSRRQRERRERRNCILDAADRVFVEKGLTEAKMEDVAAAAELSKGTLYLYFKSKDALFVAVATRIIDEVLERFAETSDGDEPGLERIRRLLTIYTRFALSRPAHFRMAVLFQVSGERVDTTTPAFLDYRERVSKIIATFVDAIQRGKRDGSVRTDIGDRELAAQIWGAIMGTLILATNRDELLRRVPQPGTFASLVPDAIRVVCDGLHPPGRPEVTSKGAS